MQGGQSLVLFQVVLHIDFKVVEIYSFPMLLGKILMNIWKKPFTIEKLNALGPDSMISNLGIEFTKFGDDWMEAEMPVDSRTIQPFGLLHGGASLSLAETLASVAGNYAAGSDYSCLGLNISGTHLRAVKKGDRVTARAIPLHIGISIQVWKVSIKDKAQHLISDIQVTLAVRRHIKICRLNEYKSV